MDRFSTAIENSGIDIVPKMVINNGANDGTGRSGNGSAFEGLMAMLLSDKLGIDLDTSKSNRETPADVKRIRDSIFQGLAAPLLSTEDVVPAQPTPPDTMTENPPYTPKTSKKTPPKADTDDKQES